MSLSGSSHTDQDIRPVPDPTSLTTEQLRRELAGLRELLEARMDGTEKDIDRRFVESITDRVRLRSDIEVSAHRISEIHDRDVAHITEQLAERDRRLQQLADEKFQSIALQFLERDVRTEQATTSADQALNAALQAAKELVNAQGESSAAAAVKSETSFTKQIDQIGTIIQTLEKALDARITELKERIDRGEGAATGSRDTHTTQTAGIGQLVAIGGFLISLIAVIVTIAVVLTK